MAGRRDSEHAPNRISSNILVPDVVELLRT
jgi:hypothetical protein